MARTYFNRALKSLFGFTLAIAFQVSAQQTLPFYQWFGAFTYNLNNIEGVGHVVDAAGNMYVVGQFLNGMDLDPGPATVVATSNGNWDVYIVKLNASGNYVWGKTFGGAAQDHVLDIDIDASGNLYLTGDFAKTVDFDPGGGVANITTINTETYILKLDGSGNYVWAKSFAAALYEYNGGKGITVDASGTVYVSGFLYGTADFDTGAGVLNISSADASTNDTYVAKLDAAGNTLWAKTFRSATAYWPNSSSGISIDAAGNVFTIGKYRNTADFDPGAGVANLPTVSFETGYLCKLDAMGNYTWVKTLPAVPEDIKVDGSGNIYTTGSGFVSKLDISGNTLFTTSIPGTGRGISVDGNGNIFTATASSAGNLLYMHSATGNQLWVYNTGNISITGSDISTDGAGNLYLSGQAVQNNAPDFDPREGYAGFGPPWVNAFAVKLGYCDGIFLASNLDSGSNYATRNIYYNNCALIATMVSAEVWNNVSGLVDAQVWVDAQQPSQYVERHYEIMPQTNPNTTMSHVVLYFTQQEFNDFNAVNTIKLPTGPTDAAGIANMIVELRSGTSSDNTGSPASYPGTPQNISGSSLQVTWNATAARWEVKLLFVQGFGGMFLKTLNTPLPVVFKEVRAVLKNDILTVAFSTLEESNSDHFDIELSADGVHFKKMASIPSGHPSNTNEYITSVTLQDQATLLGVPLILMLILLSLGFARKNKIICCSLLLLVVSQLNISCKKNNPDSILTEKTAKWYVRVAQVDKDGTINYSKIIQVVKED